MSILTLFVLKKVDFKIRIINVVYEIGFNKILDCGRQRKYNIFDTLMFSGSFS